MELTCRVYRRLRLIYGNIAKTLNPAQFRRSISGLVERLVRVFRWWNVTFFFFCKHVGLLVGCLFGVPTQEFEEAMLRAERISKGDKTIKKETEADQGEPL